MVVKPVQEIASSYFQYCSENYGFGIAKMVDAPGQFLLQIAAP
jgi:hypothetical protein